MLENALKRNVFAEIDVAEERLRALSVYMRDSRESLKQLTFEALAAGESGFPAAPETIVTSEAKI